MIPIVKKVEPPALTKAKREIRNTPDAAYDYSSLRGDAKSALLEALVAEQGHLCAYCMCRIGNEGHSATIEHLVPQHPADSASAANDGLSLSYENMVAVCDGRGGETCDKHRGNKQLVVDPVKAHTLESITYHRDGKIDAKDDLVRRDLQDTLGLNSPKTNLCANRAAAMHGIEQVLVHKIKRKGIESNRRAKARLCQRVLDRYERQDGVKDEYLGAKIYKARKLVSKFSV